MENKTIENNWVFLPVHKTRIIKELGKATLILIDFDRSTILPRVFRRDKETKEYVYYSLPKDFNANIRISVKNEKTRRYEHKDTSVNISKLVDECGLDKPYKDVEEEIQEQVGENVEPVEDEMPF